MTLARLLRMTFLTMRGLATLMAVGLGGLWVLATEPWYSDELVQVMGAGRYSPPLRNDTVRWRRFSRRGCRAQRRPPI